MGHGGFDTNADEGFLALADEEGDAQLIGATRLARLLADHPPLRLALLNACEGARGSQRDLFASTAATLVRRGLPAVLAMQYEITDEAAVDFAHAFYEALADGQPVDAAVTEARKAVSIAVNNSFEWGVPVLYMHAPDGMLFNVQASSDSREHRSEATLLNQGQESREARERETSAITNETSRETHPIITHHQLTDLIVRFADAETKTDRNLLIELGELSRCETIPNCSKKL
jgi:hypothetical protein